MSPPSTGSGAGQDRSVPRPGPVYGIADAGALEGKRPADAAAAMARAGIDWIQLRAKDLTDLELYRQAVDCRRALEGTGARFWLDDRPDVALLARADGVHVGQDDLPPAVVRDLVGPAVWVGRSTHDRQQLLEADRDPEVDVIAVGPVYPTGSKEQPDPVVGLDFVRWARRATAKPLVAIGGIGASTVADVLAAGADAAVVLSALCAGDVEANARRLLHRAAEARTLRGPAARQPEPDGQDLDDEGGT
ncbi:MAG: thiamine phosphate synthase [Thermoanaerobaculia bacterium]